VRRFSAVVLGENREALGLIDDAADGQRQYAAGVVELIIELPPKRGIGARLARTLREAAAGNLVSAAGLRQRDEQRPPGSSEPEF
jgi:hypothetical protein